MKRQLIFRQTGVTLIELLVALVIFGFVMGSIYRLFITQSRAYTVQDQVVEVQQTIRSAMEVLLRDLRMTGYDDDSTVSVVDITTPILTPVLDSDITVSYEYQNQRYSVHYWRDAATSELRRELFVNGVSNLNDREVLLENVNNLTFTYGVDVNEDGAVDDQNGDGIIDDNDWISAGGVGTSKVIAVRVELRASSTTNNPDVQQVISPRTLTSAVTFRNIMMK